MSSDHVTWSPNKLTPYLTYMAWTKMVQEVTVQGKMSNRDVDVYTTLCTGDQHYIPQKLLLIS